MRISWPIQKYDSGPYIQGGKVGPSLGDWAVWSVVEQSAKEIGIERFGAHD
jgi:hypothetical protein